MLEQASSHLKKAYGDLEKEFKKLRFPSKSSGGGGPTNIITSKEQMDRLMDELAKLRAEFDNFKDYASKHITSLENEMPLKADK